jgi:hypothetical protein
VEAATEAGVIVEERVHGVRLDAPGIATSRSRTSAWDGPLQTVLRVLPLVGLAELLLMRTFYRVGIHIPKEEPFRTIYAVLTAIGSFALNLSTILAGAALVLLGVRAWLRGSRSATASILAFVAASVVLAVAGPSELGPMARLVFAWAVLVIVVPFLVMPGRVGERVAVGLVAAVALLSSYAGLAADGAVFAPSASPGGVVGAQLIAEALVIVTALAMFVTWVRGDGLRPGPLLLAIAPALALLGLWRANGAITGILVLWTAGLRLYLPVWIYAVALWAFAATAIGWRRRMPWRTGGMVLLLVAGILLGSTYVQGLLLIALVVLTDGAAVGGLPRR